MDDLTQQLNEELDAFRPDWRNWYPSVADAARAAGVDALRAAWQLTEAGGKYTRQFLQVPDWVGAAKREGEAYRCPRSLPFGYDNLGQLESGDEG